MFHVLRPPPISLRTTASGASVTRGKVCPGLPQAARAGRWEAWWLGCRQECRVCLERGRWVSSKAAAAAGSGASFRCSLALTGQNWVSLASCIGPCGLCILVIPHQRSWGNRSRVFPLSHGEASPGSSTEATKIKLEHTKCRFTGFSCFCFHE